jgi:tetratricopeptide (TPR) repeat protein
MKRLVLLLVLSCCLAAEAVAAEAPLANAGRKGLQAKTIDEMLALPDEEIDIGLGALLIGKEYDPDLNVPKYLAQLDQMARELRSRIADETDPEKVISIMAEYIFKESGYTAAKTEDASADCFFLHRLLLRENGTCVGISTLYLALGERLGLPLFGASAPRHAFVRYSVGGANLNIEPTRKGALFSDSSCTALFFGGPTDSTFYMRNLEKREFLGILLDGLSAAYFRRGRTEESVRTRKKAIDINPAFADPWIALGWTYFGQSNLEGALAALKEGVALNRHDALGWFGLGTIHLQQKRLDEAINAFMIATQGSGTNSELAGAWLGLAVCYRQLGKMGESIRAYRKRAEIQPDQASAWYSLGAACIEAGRVGEAVEALKKATAIEPKNVDAWSKLGLAYSDQGKLKEAINAWGEAVSVDPQCAGGWYNLGNAYNKQNELRRAIRAYEKALESNPRYTEAWNNLGVAYAKQGKDDAAVRAYRRALEIDPQHASAWYGIGIIHYYSRDYSAAKQHLRKAQQLGHEAAPEFLENLRAKMKEPNR